MSDYWLALIAGFFASLHCIGMCGPIVLAYTMYGAPATGKSGTAGALPLHMTYNTGRIIAYGLLGALVGFAGSALGSVKQIGEYISIVGGAIMVMGGFFLLGLIPIPAALTSRLSGGIATKIHANLLKRPTMRSKLYLGLLTPLLPCGILYAMVVKATTTESVLGGAITMIAFGVGMAPSLILMGSFSSLLTTKFRKRAEQLAAITIIIMGVALLLRGFHIPYLRWLGGHGGHGQSCH